MRMSKQLRKNMISMRLFFFNSFRSFCHYSTSICQNGNTRGLLHQWFEQDGWGQVGIVQCTGLITRILKGCNLLTYKLNNNQYIRRKVSIPNEVGHPFRLKWVTNPSELGRHSERSGPPYPWLFWLFLQVAPSRQWFNFRRIQAKFFIVFRFTKIYELCMQNVY